MIPLTRHVLVVTLLLVVRSTFYEQLFGLHCPSRYWVQNFMNCCWISVFHASTLYRQVSVVTLQAVVWFTIPEHVKSQNFRICMRFHISHVFPL